MIIILYSQTKRFNNQTYRLYALLSFKFGKLENLFIVLAMTAGSLESSLSNSLSSNDNFCTTIGIQVKKGLEIQ